MRTVRFRPGFRERLQALCGDPQTADQVLFGARWILMRDPEQGRQVGTNTWTYLTAVPGKDFRLLIYYTFNDERVVLLDVGPQPM